MGRATATLSVIFASVKQLQLCPNDDCTDSCRAVVCFDAILCNIRSNLANSFLALDLLLARMV